MGDGGHEVVGVDIAPTLFGGPDWTATEVRPVLARAHVDGDPRDLPGLLLSAARAD